MSAPRAGRSGGVRRALLRAAALVVGLVVGLGAAELAARQLAPDPTARLVGAIGRRIDDPLLGYRTAPNTGENDARGYRNAQALESADVVALGDSQTWGVNVGLEDAWPAQLARETGLRVYNMGRGGYGIVQYASQLDMALSLEPRWIVMALYLGNDLYDAFDLAYSHDAYASLREPDPAARRRIRQSPYPDLKRMFFERVNYGRHASQVFDPLARHSALFRMLRRVVAAENGADRDRAWARAHPDDGFVYDGSGGGHGDGGDVSTVFHTSYRLAAVDTSLPRIREGLRITREELAAIAQRVEQASPEVRLLVVLIPTKERVYEPAVARAGIATPESYRKSVEDEARVVDQLVTWMDEHGVQRLDLLPALQAAIDRGQAIFPPNVDGHFTRRGYEIIAHEVATRVKAR